MCFDANTGKLLWQHSFNVFLSDVPPHRVGWASPAGDPATGNIYVFGVGGTLLGISPRGKTLWERSLSEEFGLITTHGGRTVSPAIDGDLVIVSGLSSGWGNQARAAHRFFAFDKKTGETVWVSAPGGRPFDTVYSPPLIAVINGTRLLIDGASDGAIHALKPQTGEPVWRFEMSKRGINTGVVLIGTNAIVSHSEENLDTNEMGLLAAIDAAATGNLGTAHVRWRLNGFQGGYSSPVTDGQRIYQVDNGANLFAFDATNGKQLWTINLGTIQKASPVLADGKLYVGSENGRFFILRPRADGCDILDEDQLGTEAQPEAIIASVAISRGRVFLVTSDALYAIGKRSEPAASAPPVVELPPPGASPAWVQVVPAEVVLEPGQSMRFRARLFDAQGRFLREEDAAWLLEKLSGTIGPDGTFQAAAEPKAQAGQVKATVGQLSGAGRLRVIPQLPWEENFESLVPHTAPEHWINTAGKYAVREIMGSKVLVKLADNPFTKRARSFFGPTHWSDYTVEADVMSTQRRRQMGDAGVVAQRYSLVLFGNHQRAELQSWQPETARTVTAPFPWKPDTWYRMKLRVDVADGGVRARGKVWLASEPEPKEWTVERYDPIPNLKGSPGIYADAPVEVFFDNLKITPNGSRPR